FRISGDDSGRVEAHGLVVEESDVELGGVVELQMSGVIRGERECRGVALTESELGEGRDLAEDLVRGDVVDALLARPADERPAQLLHVGAPAPAAHRARGPGRGRTRGRACACARLSTWKRPIVSTSQMRSYTAGSSSGSDPSSSSSPWRASMSATASFTSESVRSPSRSIFTRPRSSTSRLSNW